MYKYPLFILLISLSLNGYTQDPEIRTPLHVIERHMEAVLTGNSELLLEDYAKDVVIIASDRVYKSSNTEMQEFAEFLSQLQKSGAFSTIETRFEPQGDDVVKVHFSVSGEVLGTDVFVIRNGKIVFQGPQP